MGSYVLRRLVGALFVVALVSVVVFMMIHSLPGDALMTKLGEGGRLNPEQMERLRGEMGLSDPLYVQYLNWVQHIFDGSFGQSLIYDNKTVSSRILDALPVTIEFAILALATGMLIAIPLGVISAVRRDSWADYVIRIFSLCGISFPQFWVGIIVVIYGTLYFGYHLPGEYTSFTRDPVTNLRNEWIPVLVLGFGLSATAMRLTRATMLEALSQDYVRTARAKGLRSSVVIVKHVLRNALIPVVTLIGNQAHALLSGALILEVLFNFPGMGQLTYVAIQQRDYTQIQGDVLVTATIVVLINLMVDVSYGWIDPRIRYT